MSRLQSVEIVWLWMFFVNNARLKAQSYCLLIPAHRPTAAITPHPKANIYQISIYSPPLAQEIEPSVKHTTPINMPIPLS
jgi:hypothetical protein